MKSQEYLRKLLLARFVRGRAKNPNYSLRAFAQSLGQSSSAISEFLRGKRRISQSLALKILERGKFSEAEVAELCSCFETERSRRSERVVLDSERFRMISEWHHFAILSLLETEGRPTDAVIAKRLGVPEQKVKKALGLLHRLQMIERRADGRFHPTGYFASADGVSDAAIRRSHFGDAKLAQEALQRLPVELRDFTSLTFAADPANLPKARKLIRDFRDRLCRLMENGAKKEVYKLTIQLFPLTK